MHLLIVASEPTQIFGRTPNLMAIFSDDLKQIGVATQLTH